MGLGLGLSLWAVRSATPSVQLGFLFCHAREDKRILLPQITIDTNRFKK